MMMVQITDGGGAKRAMRIEAAEAVIGRDSACACPRNGASAARTLADAHRGGIISKLGLIKAPGSRSGIGQQGPQPSDTLPSWSRSVQSTHNGTPGCPAAGKSRSRIDPAKISTNGPETHSGHRSAPLRLPRHNASRTIELWRRKLHEKLLDPSIVRRDSRGCSMKNKRRDRSSDSVVVPESQLKQIDRKHAARACDEPTARALEVVADDTCPSQAIDSPRCMRREVDCANGTSSRR